MNFSRSDRHLKLIIAHSRCPECSNEDLQFPMVPSYPAQWRCGACLEEYEFEPEEVE